MADASSGDAWRFSDLVAKHLDREAAVYGGDVVPSTSLKSMSGVQRGEILFSRPELHRPWRSPAAQRQAEVVVAKEQEIELVTKRCSELRSHLAAANRDVQRLQAQLKTEVSRVTSEKDLEIERLRKEVADHVATLEQHQGSTDHQLRVIRLEHEGEVKRLETKMKILQDASNSIGATYSKQMQDIKSAAAREVELIQQLCHARTAELAAELKAANDCLRALHDRSNLSAAELATEMKKSEARCLQQLRDQEQRFDKMRETLQLERQAVETQRDKALAEVSELRDSLRTMSYDLGETETRFKDWNVRLFSDLDQLWEYYKSLPVTTPTSTADERPNNNNNDNNNNNNANGSVASAEASSATPSASTVAGVYGPPRKQTDAAGKGVMNTIVERLKQLTLIKQKHATSTLDLQRQIHKLESALASAENVFQKQAEQKDRQIIRLQGDINDAKERQDRLEAAFAEVRTITARAEGRLADAACRLQFYADDLSLALSDTNSVGGAPQPPRGSSKLALVVTYVQGSTLLWEADAAVMKAALTLLNDTLRTKMRQYGGYESATEGDSMLIAFLDAAAAIRFCSDVQLWSLQLPWSPAILVHNDSREETIAAPGGGGGLQYLFRGLRVGMAVHFGEVETELTGLPRGVGEFRVRYYGRAVLQLLHLASLAAGGQVLVSRDAWAQVCDRSPADTGSPVVWDLGEQRLGIAKRTEGGNTNARPSGGGEASYSSFELMGVLQVLPPALAGRVFPKIDAAAAAAAAASGAHSQQSSIAQHLTPFRRMAIDAEINGLRAQHAMITKATEVLAEEAAGVAAAVETLGCKLRDAQVHGRVYSQADIVAHVAALDRVAGRTDAVRRGVARTVSAQKDLTAQQRNLEDVLIVHTKVATTEEEYRRRIDALQERCNERVYEATLQADAKLQQQKSINARLEHANNELRRHVFAAAPPPSGTADAAAREQPVAAAGAERPRSAHAARADAFVPRVASLAPSPAAAGVGARKPVVATTPHNRNHHNNHLAADPAADDHARPRTGPVVRTVRGLASSRSQPSPLAATTI